MYLGLPVINKLEDVSDEEFDSYMEINYTNNGKQTESKPIKLSKYEIEEFFKQLENIF